MVGHHDVAQVLALQAAAPSGSNQRVYLCSRVDCDQRHGACMALGNNQHSITGVLGRQKWQKAGLPHQEDV